MDRRNFIKLLLGAPVTAKSYFFFGGIYRPADPAIVIDMASKIIRVRGLETTLSVGEFLDQLRGTFGKSKMPMVPAFPGWRYVCVDGWKLDRVAS